MNDLDPSSCQCVNCVGADCTCGCQNSGNTCACAPSCECGDQCRCEAGCNCKSAVEG